MSIKLVERLSKPINTSAVSIMAFYTVIWGVFVTNPWVETFGTNPEYMTLLVIAPEWTWGLLAFVVGLIGLYGLIKPSYKTVTQGAFVACVFWLAVSFLCLVGGWTSVAWLNYLAPSAYSAFVYLNLRINRKSLKFD